MNTEHVVLDEARDQQIAWKKRGPTSVNDMGNRMKIVERMQIKENTISFKTEGRLKNVARHCTEAGQGHAFLVASVSGEEDSAAAARAAYSMIADTLYDKRMAIVHERLFGSLIGFMLP